MDNLSLFFVSLPINDPNGNYITLDVIKLGWDNDDYFCDYLV